MLVATWRKPLTHKQARAMRIDALQIVAERIVSGGEAWRREESSESTLEMGYTQSADFQWQSEC